MGSISRAGDNSNGLFLNKLNLVKVVLRYAAEDDWTVIEMGLKKSEVESFECRRSEKVLSSSHAK